MKDQFKSQYKKKLLLAVSLGLFVACIAVALVSVLPLYSQLKIQQANNLSFAVTTRSMVVEEFLAKARDTARQFTSRSKIREFLEKYNRGEIELLAFQKFTAPKLGDALSLSEDAVGITRLDRKGIPVVEVGISIPKAYLSNLETANRDPMIKGPVKYKSDLYIVVSASIFNKQNQFVGTDVVLFSIAALKGVVQDYTGLGRTGETILGGLDEKGRAFIFFDIRYEQEKNSSKLITQRTALSTKELQKSLAEKSKPGNRLHEENSEMIASGIIPAVNWGVLVMMNKDELFEPVTQQVIRIALVIILLIIPFGVFGLLLLLRPLSHRLLIHVDTLQQEINAKEEAILKREQAEQNILDERERLNVTLQSIADGVISTDINGKVVFINKVAEKLICYEQNKAIGQSVENVFHIIDEDTGEFYEHPVSQRPESGDAVLIACNNRCVIEYGSSPIFDKTHNMVGSVLVFRDVTERRRIQEELFKAQKIESVGVLAGGIAHDFNNILAIILGNVELAEMTIGSDNKAYALLKVAEDACARAVNLTQQLLTFSRGGDPIKKTTSIQNTITESVDFVLHGSPVSCEFDIPADLWLVDIDSGQIGQVIQNLVINAIHAMPNGGKIQISCANLETAEINNNKAEQGQSYIKIVVRDTGIGIDEEYLSKIFDPYYSTKDIGNGLGLAITHSIIKKHNGFIDVESIVGMVRPLLSIYR